MNESPLDPKIVFDDQYDRDVRSPAIDFRKLIDIMNLGMEPINTGQGWTVEVRDIDGFTQRKQVEETVINQVRAFGIASISRTATSISLRLRGGRGREVGTRPDGRGNVESEETGNSLDFGY